MHLMEENKKHYTREKKNVENKKIVPMSKSE